jgi:hypothetical protein
LLTGFAALRTCGSQLGQRQDISNRTFSHRYSSCSTSVVLTWSNPSTRKDQTEESQTSQCHALQKMAEYSQHNVNVRNKSLCDAQNALATTHFHIAFVHRSPQYTCHSRRGVSLCQAFGSAPLKGQEPELPEPFVAEEDNTTISAATLCYYNITTRYDTVHP